MISEDQNKALLLVAEKTRQVEEWRKYAEYCTLREKGLAQGFFFCFKRISSRSEAMDL